MYTVVWNDENLNEFEEQFEDLYEATCFMEDLPDNAQLYFENGIRIKRII